jgi:hypothetical protein
MRLRALTEDQPHPEERGGSYCGHARSPKREKKGTEKKEMKGGRMNTGDTIFEERFPFIETKILPFSTY